MIKQVTKTMSLEARKLWFDEIMSRLCSLYKVTKNTHLARIFDFGPDAPKQMKARGEIPLTWLNAAVLDLNSKGRGVSLDWLLYGVEVNQIKETDLQVVKVGLQKALAKLAMANHVSKEFVNNESYNTAVADLMLRDVAEELQRHLSANTDETA